MRFEGCTFSPKTKFSDEKELDEVKMRKNSSAMNLILMYVFVFLLIAITEVYSKDEYVPTLIWTSREFEGRKNVDYLVLKKVKSDLFESYIMEVLESKKPLLVVFLEQDLGTDDLEWKDENGDNSFPFLSNLTVNSRVDYFRSVQSPHQTLAQLTENGYKWKHSKSGTNLNLTEGDFMLVEFEKIKSKRSEAMRKHDATMAEVHQQLWKSGKSWISIYTAKHSHDGDFFSDLKQMSPWHVEKQFQEKSNRTLSLYQDEFTGFTLMTKGSLQLLLPSPRNLALKSLENYLVASAKPLKNTTDFVIWFSNYTLTFHLDRLKDSWIIKGAKLLNGNGDSLNLTPRQQESRSDRKCYVQLTEFRSEGKPVVKVIVSKYKFLELQTHEQPCKKPYGFHLTLSLIVASILSAVVCWNKLLENWDFTTETKTSSISIPAQDLYSLPLNVIS